MANNQRSLSEQFRDDMNRALKRTGDWLEQRFGEEMSEPKWDWPSEPSPRDIVDSGRLRASMQRDSRPGSETFSWPMEYAAQVHEGAVLRNGRRLPGRPWTVEPLREAEQKFETFLREEIKKTDKQ
jgi:hypothetical protein